MIGKEPDNKLLWRYAGLTTQILFGVGLALYLGQWLDKQIGWKKELLVWVLPLVVLLGIFYQIIRDTSKKQ
jgi:cyanate permease